MSHLNKMVTNEVASMHEMKYAHHVQNIHEAKSVENQDLVGWGGGGGVA